MYAKFKLINGINADYIANSRSRAKQWTLWNNVDCHKISTSDHYVKW